jgi:hypothetical protein
MKNDQVEPNIKGSLTVGMIAGLVILSRGFSAPPPTEKRPLPSGAISGCHSEDVNDRM